MASIRSLKPNVTREQALEHFSRGVSGFLRRSVFGPLRSVAEFYIPFRLFHVEILNSGRRERRIFGLDAVSGTLDLYSFPQLPGEGDLIGQETHNCVPARLEGEDANRLVLSKVRRLLFSTGFFRMRDLHISAEAVPGEIYVPYWVGFRGRGTGARFAVLDAVRRQVEGTKVTQMLESWLLSENHRRAD